MEEDGRGWDGIDEVTEKVIGCAFAVSNQLGRGFLEKVYENALAHELRKAGIPFAQQKPVKVKYDGVVVGDYVADLIIEEVVLIELKATTTLCKADHAQAWNYLKATGFPICLLLNFGTQRMQIKRIVLEQNL